MRVLAAGLLGFAVALPASAQEATSYDPTSAMSADYRGDAPGVAAWNDPDHPLKGEEDPGSAWDGANVNNWHDDHKETPPIRNATGNWPWGEMFYDKTYETELVATNRCPTPQTVYITVHDLPYLKGLPDQVDVPGDSEVDLPVTIETPPEPDPPINPTPFDPSGPGFGWVQPPDLPPQPNPFDPTAPKWHQPNFLPVKGRVVLWHPWKDNCQPRRVTYNADGHIHFNPPDDTPPDRGPEKLATPDPCTVYWLTGEEPPNLDDQDCTETFRGLAIAFLETVIAPRAAEDPDAWGWTPTVDQLQSMPSDELLAFRDRAAQILNVATGP